MPIDKVRQYPSTYTMPNAPTDEWAHFAVVNDRLQFNSDGSNTRILNDNRSLVAAGSSLTLTAASHNGSTIALDTASGSTVILPTSTGGGAVYKILVTVTATSNSHVIRVGNATDEFRGFVIQDASEATAPNIWWAADNDDTITLNRSTTGLAAQGEYFEIVDATSGHYFVRGYSQASGIEATPFSATVS